MVRVREFNGTATENELFEMTHFCMSKTRLNMHRWCEHEMVFNVKSVYRANWNRIVVCVVIHVQREQRDMMDAFELTSNDQ